MNPERFDELTRLWVMAPSRRVFLLQVGAVFAYGALGRVGIRIPRWLGKAEDVQCLPGFSHREGMPCGSRPECGICQNGKCIAALDSACQAKDPCLQCDSEKITCTKCPKGKQCCKDGCCDGKCTEDGACCPQDKQCGQNKELCCRECEECKDNTCQKPVPPKECPEKTHRLEKDCCVCRTRLCGGKCCDAPCLEGKCCEECGLDRAVCCDGRKCCRERCVDPAAAAKCCECWEDISEKEANAVLERTNRWAKYQQDNKVPYGQDQASDPNDPAPQIMDCSYFVQKALGIEVLRSLYEKKPKPERLSTRVLDGNCFFRRLKPGEAPRAGDLVAQPRSSGAPGSMHVGVATGTPGAQGGHQGIAMGNGKDNRGSTAVSTWGLTRGEGGSFEGGDQLRVYRPQKRKANCPEG